MNQKMNFQEFRQKIKTTLPVGVIIKNPGSGTSTIHSYSDENIVYKRGKSLFTLSFDNLYQAYLAFKGKNVSTTDLKDFSPSVFDSKNGGHSCHGTFLFLILKLIGLTKSIDGKGVANHPFHITIL